VFTKHNLNEVMLDEIKIMVVDGTLTAAMDEEVAILRMITIVP